MEWLAFEIAFMSDSRIRRTHFLAFSARPLQRGHMCRMVLDDLCDINVTGTLAEFLIFISRAE